MDSKKNVTTLSRVFILATILWTLVLALLFTVIFFYIKDQVQVMSLKQARAFYEQIVITRYWNSLHGGVYVPVGDLTQPNPYLEAAGRDVVTTGGMRLTKVNPAFMTRQISEAASEKNQVQFHMTSLKPIRPGNRADRWEEVSLKLFERGVHERFIFLEKKGAVYFRYMAPLKVDASCLACHAKQGYREGDIRGGISVTQPAEDIISSQNRVIYLTAAVFILLWCTGLVGLYFSFKNLNASEKKRERVILDLEDALSRVKTLSGMIPICASCKKIRNDSGYWEQVESYIAHHTDSEFTHGICPECARKLYPQFYDGEEEKK